MSRDPAPCGSYAAAMRHRRNREPLDDACQVAVRNYMRAFRKSRPDVRDRDRWWVRTRNRALERLATEYPQRLAELLAGERAEGGPW